MILLAGQYTEGHWHRRTTSREPDLHLLARKAQQDEVHISRRTTSGTRILPMPWPEKSTEMVRRDRWSVIGSTRRSATARIGPSMPRTPQVAGGSIW
jgi:hypothetical protein